MDAEPVPHPAHDPAPRRGRAAAGRTFASEAREYLSREQNPDGGFPGREGGSDLYYTGFALRSLAVLQALTPEVCSGRPRFLRETDDRLGGRGRLLLARRELLPRPARRRAGRPRRRPARTGGTASPRRSKRSARPTAGTPGRPVRPSRQHVHQLPRRALLATARPADPAPGPAGRVREVAPPGRRRVRRDRPDEAERDEPDRRRRRPAPDPGRTRRRDYRVRRRGLPGRTAVPARGRAPGQRPHPGCGPALDVHRRLDARPTRGAGPARLAGGPRVRRAVRACRPAGSAAG